MSEIEFQDYLLFTSSLAFEANMATMQSTRISPPEDDPVVPRRSPARLIDRWKLPSQRLMKTVADTKSKATTLVANAKNPAPYNYGKTGCVPDSPSSFAESTSSFEMEDDDVKGNEIEACLSSKSDTESVFSNPGSFAPEPKEIIQSDQEDNNSNNYHEDDERFEELLQELESIQICQIEEVVTMKHVKAASVARVEITAASST
ncbi:hypothetical protein CANMA_004955 [Candida margitis]|uniref:uncharacterized protein n=1 Tax=Candida margitis TaxID=1775924 RepID=UPI00222711DF|nr:uncharacterized protein CANMA_004955 [Candida margitis]KAI5954116.1 hypothetical protein CANMA_004955 [Candida margitis]